MQSLSNTLHFPFRLSFLSSKHYPRIPFLLQITTKPFKYVTPSLLRLLPSLTRITLSLLSFLSSKHHHHLTEPFTSSLSSFDPLLQMSPLEKSFRTPLLFDNVTISSYQAFKLLSAIATLTVLSIHGVTLFCLLFSTRLCLHQCVLVNSLDENI
jgi:hypothetical protein